MSDLYLVICGTKDHYVPERDLQDMTRERTIADLAAGEWGDINGRRFMVSSIIELETGADRTEEFIELAKLQMESYGPSRQSKLEWEADHKLAMAFNQ